jgi:hypothetical protein
LLAESNAFSPGEAGRFSLRQGLHDWGGSFNPLGIDLGASFSSFAAGSNSPANSFAGRKDDTFKDVRYQENFRRQSLQPRIKYTPDYGKPIN